MSKKPDLTLLLRDIAADKDQAMEKFYDHTISKVYSLALRITRQKTLAEEVVGDVYLQVWRHAQDYNPARGEVLAWLTVICRSRALDILRANKSIFDTTQLDSEQAIDNEQPDDLLHAIERGSELHKALNKLSTHERQLLALAFFKGFSHSELADFTGLPLGTVKSQLRRALQSLKLDLSKLNGLYGKTDE